MIKKILLATLIMTTYSIHAFAGGYPGSAPQADAKLEQLEKMIIEQGKTINSLQKQVSFLQDENQSELGMLPPTASASLQSGEELWTDRIKFFGDFLLRHQIIGDKASGPVRNRTRMRVRPGLKAKVNDDIDFLFRLTTGEPARSNYQTFDDFFDSKDIFIDLAYVHYHPKEIFGYQIQNDIIKSVEFFGGKMYLPFYRAGKNQIIWDHDVRPEGGAVKIKGAIPDTDTTFWTTIGGFVVDEDADDADASLWAAQAGFCHQLGEHENLGNMQLCTGITYYNYGSIEGRALPAAGGALGNTTVRGVPGGMVEADVYAVDFDILEVFAELKMSPLDIPVALYGMYLVNLATDDDHQAWGIGTKIGATKNVGDWECGYFYRRVEADSVLGIFTDSEFLGGGTDGHGHAVQVGYKLAQNVKAQSVAMLSRKIIEDTDDFWTMWFDLIFFW